MRRIISLVFFVLLITTPAVLGASWSGHVFDNSSVAINSANVSAILANNSSINSTLTDAVGFFNISISDSTSVRLVTSKNSYQNDTSQALPPITADFVLPFNITLIKNLPGNITGRVTDSGSGIGNAVVEALQANITKGSAVTDSNGEYTIAGLLDGTYTVRITADSVTQLITNVVVSPGSTAAVNSTFVATPAAAAVTGGGGGGGSGRTCPRGYGLVNGECVVIGKAAEYVFKEPEEQQEKEPEVSRPVEAKPAVPGQEAPLKEMPLEERFIQIPLEAGIAVLAIFAVLAASIILSKIRQVKDSGKTMHNRLYKALHQAHALIREKDFKKALHSYYGIQKKYDSLSTKAKRGEVKLHRDIEKLHDEVRLYLMIDELHKQALDGDMRGLRTNMHAVMTLAHKVAREVPGDRALYSYASRQYEHCRQLLKEHDKGA